jgi:Protein of unknown function (DUF3843)
MLFNKKPSLAWYLGRKPYKTINTSYDQKYFKVLEELVGVMIQHYRKNPWNKTPLEISEIYEIAYMLTGYLEDFVSEIGFWQAIRNKNKEIYGTPVPLFLKPNTLEFDSYDDEDLNIEDICLMLWYNLGLYYDITFNPQNRGIRLMAEDILEVMTDHYDTLDGTSFYDDFLHVEKGEDWGKIKQKIHWFAYKSPFVQLECHKSRRDRKTSDATDWNLPQLEQILKDEDIFSRTSMRWHGQLC